MSEKLWNEHFNKGCKRYSRNAELASLQKYLRCQLQTRKKRERELSCWGTEIEVTNNSVQKIVSLSQWVWTQVFLVKEVLLTHTAVTLMHINQINLS